MSEEVKIIECVPNFSEGIDPNTISAIQKAIETSKDVKLLNLESDSDYNRTVATFIGNEKSILKAAVNASVEAAKRIDMRFHRGVHPRIGAIDVVPFIPIKNTSIEECIDISKKYGKIISEKLKVPVFLYEKSAENKFRENLANIRSGNYENLFEKFKLPEWKPDFGEAVFNPKLGAIVTGARNFLIAYNVHLDTADISIAKKIAGTIRESGMYNSKVNKTIPGFLKKVKAIGVYLSSQKFCQVSVNIINYKVTPIHVVYETIKEEASKYKVKVLGSEIIGMIPEDAILAAGKFYAEQELSKNNIINNAIENLGLSIQSKFDPTEKIIRCNIYTN